LKHADARTVRMHIFTRGSSIVLRIEHDGKGFDTAQPSLGRCMPNMREGARDCQGKLSVTALNPGP
jgi:signal transduction histidine kinase